MIIVNIKGGLGNQMFQYAFARALSLRKKAPFKLDISSYPKQDLRSYTLSNFNIEEHIASPQEVRQYKYPYGALSKAWRFFSTKILRRFHIGFEPQLLHGSTGAYYDGYFQSEDYFIDFEETIRSDFTPSKPLPLLVSNLISRIQSDSASVSLHIRRGDYVTNASANSHHGLPTIEYYQAAADYLSDHISKDIKIYVFSDDIDWAKENLSLGYPTQFVSSPDIKDYEELFIMAACKHNIIANSSFSWWAAWLNPNQQKMVIAPSRWLAGKPDPYKTVPSTWIRL